MPCDLGWSQANIYGSSIGWIENTRMYATYLLFRLEGIKIALHELSLGPGLNNF